VFLTHFSKTKLIIKVKEVVLSFMTYPFSAVPTIKTLNQRVLMYSIMCNVANE